MRAAIGPPPGGTALRDGLAVRSGVGHAVAPGSRRTAEPIRRLCWRRKASWTIWPSSLRKRARSSPSWSSIGVKSTVSLAPAARTCHARSSTFRGVVWVRTRHRRLRGWVCQWGWAVEACTTCRTRWEPPSTWRVHPWWVIPLLRPLRPNRVRPL
uniref:(northern house mosquito) hypothetical protein n=1 Tax=Culex pipiens TaxID=7175 RepID=A0A8D8FRH2_CULPI